MTAVIITTMRAAMQRNKNNEAITQQVTVARVMRALALIGRPDDKQSYLETHDTTTLLALRSHMINNWKPVYISQHRANDAVLETRGYQPI